MCKVTDNHSAVVKKMYHQYLLSSTTGRGKSPTAKQNVHLVNSRKWFQRTESIRLHKGLSALGTEKKPTGTAKAAAGSAYKGEAQDLWFSNLSNIKKDTYGTQNMMGFKSYSFPPLLKVTLKLGKSSVEYG